MAHETLGNIGSYISYDEDEGFIRKETQMQNLQQNMTQQLQGAPVAGVTDTIKDFWGKYGTWIIVGGVAVAAIYFLWLRKPAGGAKRMYEYNPKKRK